MTKLILDGKGKPLGREVNGIMLGGTGKVVARYVKASDRTVNGKGEVVGKEDLRMTQLGSNLKHP
jgi:hypothetical protein